VSRHWGAGKSQIISSLGLILISTNVAASEAILIRPNAETRARAEAIIAHEEAQRQAIADGNVEDLLAEPDPDRDLKSGDLFHLKNSIQAILLERDDQEVFNKGGGGLVGQIVTLLDNTPEAAEACRFSSDEVRARVLARTKPCAGSFRLIMVEGFATPNEAPPRRTCLCTSARNLSAQPYMVGAMLTQAGSEPEPDSHVPYGYDEDEPTGEDAIELHVDADSLDEGYDADPEMPETELFGPPVLVNPSHSGFVPAGDYTVYRPNGTFAEGTGNLAFEVLNRQPIQGTDKEAYHLGRLWRVENGTYEPFKHELIYAVPAAEIKPENIPPHDSEIPNTAEVFKGPFTGPPRTSTHIDTQLPLVPEFRPGTRQISSAARRLGYYTFNTGDGYVWGRPQTIWTLQEAGRRLAKKGIVMGINDINKKGSDRDPTYGNTLGHSSHKRGTDVDFRPVFEDGISKRGTWRSAGYSSAKTITMLKELIDVNPDVKVIYFNDPVVIKEIRAYLRSKRIRARVGSWAGHDNHIHFGWNN
jgi:hypothetical protein